MLFTATYSRSAMFTVGPPRPGKSSVARELSTLLGLPVLDVDDDVLERNWGQSVAEKLRELGDDAFLHAEAKELRTVNAERTIISLSGSQTIQAQQAHSRYTTPHTHCTNASHVRLIPIHPVTPQQIQSPQQRRHGAHHQECCDCLPRLPSSQCTSLTHTRLSRANQSVPVSVVWADHRCSLYGCGVVCPC